VRRHARSTNRDDWGAAVGVGPAGGRVFVTGEEVTTKQRTSVPRSITIAYDAE